MSTRLSRLISAAAGYGIEKFAMDRGLAQIDAQVLDQAKDFFGM